MNELEYDRIERQTESGMKVCLEFPRTGTNGAQIAREVKDILSGTLRESLNKASNDEF